MTVAKILKKPSLDRADLSALIGTLEPQERQALYNAAYAVKAKEVGRVAYYRGLLEFSNQCIKNCLYCGIRRDNTQVERFTTSREDILAMAKWAYDNRYGSLTLQSGERQDEEFTKEVEDLIHAIKDLSHGELGLTLCVGEQSPETYQRWFEAGAHRYLLRIETSNPRLYATLHPQDGHHEWSVRKHCLEVLRDIGYQVGTGVMIGLPGQTTDDLADDILFFRDMDIDMIGMGPYVVHHETPLGKQVMAAGENSKEAQQRRFLWGLNMIAATRLLLRDVNIAATTALQALHPLGRELGLKAGANILMPIVTVPEYRPQYLLYDNKPCVEDSPDQCRNCLSGRVASVGDRVGFGEWGDSPHFYHEHKDKRAAAL
ncbi:[FeFe] hydrogenase H-cluster radical SAM maturase HydE [Acidaminococcus sp. NSJ-142]|jgi:biotin synthase|uniref:[FeFe] hydrogenase H-cluster radical SAM maturase HydE n=1 Tax=Acidaminococcus TaxID=904 RepID=UPI000CFA7AD3|nr:MULTISPECIES: [FeFe] hydrogenase H-cluster radical SAM maturase HydE [Acidaminococcus]MCD2434613.1 [FeFe] hydrogenase H-cluster radical SAM maturase HydE [Acidaminococcus hominis]MCH4097003.1 [FeFe] hydrogenase H-cluster radical SAM maturase HydE [Acidaminococcus provencensis]RHK03886.1 [FeFe] hydrogenase H-cluster radical SAM maturase HydE [Acidaminococcus sp. AM05-11]